MKWLIGTFVLAAAGGTVVFWPAEPEAESSTKETVTLKVTRGDLTLYVTANGEIKAFKEVELKSKASGQVVRFSKDPGSPVEEGELVAELDRKVEERNLAREKSNLSSAQARLKLTRLEHNRSLAQAQSGVASAEEDEQVKKADLARLEGLSRELLTESELGAARLAARLAEESTKQADAQLILIQERHEADMMLAGAEVSRAEVALDDAEERLADTSLRAPMKGILLKKLVEEGQIVASGIQATTGGTPIAVVADVSTLLVEANIDETDITRVRKDQSVEVTLSSGVDDSFKGRVDLILPKGEVDSNIIVFKVRITLEGDIFGRAYPGMSASVKILAEERKDCLLIPSSAVHIVKGKSTVRVPKGEEEIEVEIVTGIDDGENIEVIKGLAEGDEIRVTRTKLGDAEKLRSRMRF